MFWKWRVQGVLLVVEEEILDLSMNIKFGAGPSVGAVPCICPGSKLWMRGRQRVLTAVEKMQLQGMMRGTYRRGFDRAENLVVCVGSLGRIFNDSLSLSFGVAMRLLPAISPISVFTHNHRRHNENMTNHVLNSAGV